MLKKIMLTALGAAGLAMPLQAQDYQPLFSWYNSATKADATFRLCDHCITQRHTAMLGGGNFMVIELYAHSSYELIPDLESTLAKLRENLTFVADSIRDCPQCNYRIDYALNRDGSGSYRLQKYLPKGTFLYAKPGDELRPFKPEADTLHLLLQDVSGTSAKNILKRAQVTFVLNRFANLDSLLAQHGRLNYLVDTMRKRSEPKTRSDRKNWYGYRTSVFLSRNYKDTSKLNVVFQRGIAKEGVYTSYAHNTLDIQVNFGAGFLRDHIAPLAEGGLFYRLPATRGDDVSEQFVGLYASGYFAFGKDGEGQYELHDNWFLNAEFGAHGRNDAIYTLVLTRLSLGLGYLVSQKGGYFTGPTVKAFMNFSLKGGVTLTPEVIVTNNFGQVFPGFTIKIF